MKITAQLSGVNRPLSVELRLMTFVPAIFDSQEENHTAPGQLLLTERSDFRSAEGLARGSPFGGVESGKQRTTGLANAAEAYGRMMRNEARFRIVLVTGQQARSVSIMALSNGTCTKL